MAIVVCREAPSRAGEVDGLGDDDGFKPNSITVARSKLARSLFGASSEPASVMEFGFLKMM